MTIIRNQDGTFTVTLTVEEQAVVSRYRTAKGGTKTAAQLLAGHLSARMDEMAAWLKTHVATRRQAAYDVAPGTQRTVADQAIGFSE